MKAIKYEKQLKGWTRAKKEALIVNDLDLLHELAKCKNETSHETYNESGFDFAHPDSLTTVTSTGKDGPGKIFLLDL